MLNEEVAAVRTTLVIARQAIQRTFCLLSLNRSPELVHALQRSLTSFVGIYIEDEGATISMAATARIPIEICPRPEAGIFSRQALQGRINCLLFGGGEAN